MIPYSYNMVDMGGIDLAEANGTRVPGIYERIDEAVNACGDVILYNWKFAGIEISPQYTSILLGNPIVINGAIQITSADLVTVPGLNPDPPILVPLLAEANGQYSPLDYDADGFSSAEVDVPPPNLEILTATQNNTEYFPSEGYVGFSKVIIAIADTPPVIVVSVEGGYNGGAVVTASSGGLTFFRGVGNSPYNLIYTPNTASVLISGNYINLEVPNLQTNSSPLIINLSWGEISKTVQFMHTGANTSYGYGSQSTEVDFGE